MKFALLLAFSIASNSTYAQTGFNGTWQTRSGGSSWTVVLRTFGPSVTGVAQGCGAVGAVDVSDGRIEGDTITFKCKSPNGDNTLTFTGKKGGGDRITFPWKHDIRDGNPRFCCCANSELFGVSAPPSFVATRVADGALAAIADRVHGRVFATA